MKKRYHIRVYGRVQGVGFRYFVLQKAQEEALTGRVVNMPDGSVDIEAQGALDALERFTARVKKGSPFSSVDRIERDEMALAEKEKKFSVDYF